ncbi:MAG: DUF87 domain-containing protein [Thermaerobacter sp.]|nr:DUF87 domain-containing protein [Thermaerobacter sp.]
MRVLSIRRLAQRARAVQTPPPAGWQEAANHLTYFAGALSVAHQAWAVREWPPGLVGDRLNRALAPVRPGTWPLVQWVWRWQSSPILLSGGLDRKIRRLELAVQERSQTKLGPRRDEWTALAGLQAMRDALVFEGEALVEVDAVVTITSTPDLLADDVALLVARWEALGLQLRPLPYEQALAARRSWGMGDVPVTPQHPGWRAWLRTAISGHPTAPAWEPRVTTAERAAGLVWPGWGYVSDEPEAGVYVGHTPEGQPTFVNFYQDEGGNAANVLAAGATGMGKSFWLKTVARGWLAENFGTVIFDVDGEYARLCEAEDGLWIDVSGMRSSDLPDSLTIPPAVGHPDIDALRYDRMLQNVSQLAQILGSWDLVTKAAFERAVMGVWARYGVQPTDPRTWEISDDAPHHAMREVWEELAASPDPAAQNAARRLWIYIEGSQRMFFAGTPRRWAQMPAPLVVWHLGNLALQGGITGNNDLPPETAGRYWLVLQTTWEWLRQRRQRGVWTAVLADEGQRLLHQPILGTAMADLASTIRKWNGVLAFATNTPDALWQTPAGQMLWGATPIRAFWRLEEAQAQAAAQALRMPSAIRHALSEMPEHHVLMRLWHDQWTLVQAQVPPEEAALYRTRG